MTLDYVWFEVLTAVSMMMEAVRTFELLLNLHQFTRRYNPEDSHLKF
jgi:hypothetical protein